MFYRKIYSNTWKTLSVNFPLLIFGAFVSILGFNELSLIYTMGDSGPDVLASMFKSFYYAFYIISVSPLSINTLPYLLALGLIFMLFAAIIIMAVASQGALIASVKNRNKRISLMEKLRIGLEKFWPLLGLNVLNTLIGYFFITIIIDQLVFMAANFDIGWLSNLLISIIIFFVFIPFIVVVSFVTRYGAAYIVLENQDIDTAFLSGWTLFKINWLITLENALFLLLITIGYFAILMIALDYLLFFLIILLPNIGITTLFINSINLIIFVLGTAFYASFYNMLWAEVFKELTTGKKSHSKIHRIAAKHVPYMAK